jgi:DNA-binding transcriptional regulator PaaX
MGQLEENTRKRKRRTDIKKMVLSTIAAVGMIGVFMVAPNVIGAMDKLGFLPGKRQREIINRVRDRLIKQGYLIKVDGHLRLSAKGKRLCASYELQQIGFHKPRKWDGKWRVLIFDIPEHRKFLRDKIRSTLQTIGFVRLQDSVWIFPYDCEDLITLFKADFRVGKDLLYMVVEELEGASRLRRHFGLH